MKSFLKTIVATAIGTVAGSLILFFIFMSLIAALTFDTQDTKNKINNETVLYLPLNGRLVEKAPEFQFDLPFFDPVWTDNREVGLYDANEVLELAKSDPRVQGLYLKIGAIEANWADLASLRRSLATFKESGKFVAVYAEDYDEQTLYLASVADRIALQPNGSVEFNGLSATPVFLKGLLEKLEIEPRIFRVGRFKSAIEPLILEKMSDENRLQYQALLSSIWSHAKEVLSSSGKTKGEDFDDLAAKLKVDSASRALQEGLVTETAFEHELRQSLRATISGQGFLNLVSFRQYLKSNTLSRISSTAQNKVAIIFADGEIASGKSGDGTVGSDSFVRDIREILLDDDVKAVVLRINSPGGEALAADSMWAELKNLNAKIPVVASFGGIAASGGYYIGAGARHIFSEDSSITGSIGVFGILFDTTRFFKNKMGINFDRVVTNEYADIGNFNRPMDPVEAAFIQKSVNAIYERFLAVVRQGRSGKLKKDVEEIAEGRVWSGQQALEIGLVDEIGGLPQATAKAAELSGVGGNYRIEIWPRESDPITQFINELASASVREWLGSERAMVLARQLARWQEMKSGAYMLDPIELRIR